MMQVKGMLALNTVQMYVNARSIFFLNYVEYLILHGKKVIHFPSTHDTICYNLNKLGLNVLDVGFI